ncbi:MAG: outer membrane beta-barrel protein [Coraliomargarita sp.]
MKNKIALASAFVAASSLATAEIVINDFLSFEGFIDMSYSHTDVDSDISILDGSDNSFDIDQVEIDWLFDFDTVTAQIDLAYEGSDGDQETAVEQAFATYHFDNGGAITAGRFASMLGFEAFEPTGLYQFSFAYDMSILPGYAQGVKFTHESDNTFFGLSLLDSYVERDIDDPYNGRLGGSDDSSYAFEIAGAYYMDNGLGFFLGGYYEDIDGDGVTSPDGDNYAINAYVTFETGAWIFAAELNYGETEADAYGVDFGVDPVFGNLEIVGTDDEAMSGLLMANYAYSDKGSITGRISYESFEYENQFDDEIEQIKFTLAHGYAFTDNLSLVTEISYSEATVENNLGLDEDIETLLGAVELIFAF